MMQRKAAPKGGAFRGTPISAEFRRSHAIQFRKLFRQSSDGGKICGLYPIFLFSLATLQEQIRARQKEERNFLYLFDAFASRIGERLA
jgi:hypothetical protein